MRKEMDELRGKNTYEDPNPSLSKFIQNDYFYKELSSKPKVSFAVSMEDQGRLDKSSDPVDAMMNQRPDRQAAGR